MRHDELRLLREANPARLDEVRREIEDADARRIRERAVALAEGGADLLGEETAAVRAAPVRTRRRVPAIALAAALFCALAVVVGIVLGGDSAGPGGERAFAAEAVRIAEANPRLLVGAEGWSVTRADEFELDRGSIEFGDGEDALTIEWRRIPDEHPLPEQAGMPLPERDQWYRLPIACREAPCASYARQSEIEVLGEPAILEELRTLDADGEARTRFTVHLPIEDRVAVEISTASLSRQQLDAILSSLYAADVETWLSALPPSVVQPLERPEVIDEMLEGVPVHPSVDVAELKGQPAARSRYGLGSAVTAAVACAWLDQWAAAVRSGDEDARAEAVEAMSTSREWPILRELESRGGWSEVIWDYAREMRRDRRWALLGLGGSEALPDGSVLELRPAYAVGLGCESQRRVPSEGGAAPPGFPPPGFPPPVPVDVPTPPQP